MPWPASKTTLKDRLDRINRVASRVKGEVQSVRTRSLTDPVDRRLLLQLQRSIDQAIDELDAAVALPAEEVSALIAYAKSQFGDDMLDVAAEFTAMRSAAISLRNWIHANFPRDAATGAVLVETVSQEGAVTQLTFTSTQLAGFRDQADAFVATIA